MNIDTGIILAGGKGTRLQPFTKFISKHLLNLNGKCIIDYPINTLKQMGIKNLTIVVGSDFSGQIVDYIGDGSNFDLNVNFIYQKEPLGISHAVNLCQKYVKDAEKFVVCLGDNIFSKPIVWSEKPGAQIVLDSSRNNLECIKRFGVATVNKAHSEILNIIEKPQTFDYKLYNYPITGCYLFDQKYFEYFKNLTPSQRGEYEIVSIIEQYLKDKNLNWTYSEGFWSDAGTIESLAETNMFLSTSFNSFDLLK